MNGRIAQWTVTAIVLLCATGLQARGGSRQPNILYIFTDDQSHRTVGCYPEAHNWVRTPNIDRLAEEGARFTDCYTGTWCMASRATALTGRLQHGIESMRMVGKYPGNTYDPQQCPFWPSVFRKHGYYTGIIGKWHTGADTGHGRDWDYSAVWNHANRHEVESGGYYRNQRVSFNGAPPVAVGGYSTDNYTRWAVEFIGERAKKPNTPWYLWLCYDGVHGPYTAADRHEGDYRDTPPVSVPADIFPPRPTKPDYMKNYGVWKKGKDGNPVAKGRTLTEAVQKYNRAVLALDEGVGKVLEALHVTGQVENTLVVFTSDQGYAWGQHGFEWKYAPYDANLRAPLLVRYPKLVPPGSVCTHPVGGHDLIRTFFALAGIAPPWEMHGRDISPLLADPSAPWDEPVLLLNTGQKYGSDSRAANASRHSGVPWWIFVRRGQYKYVRTLEESEMEELYDLQADPDELVNLALDPHYADVLREYRRQLLDELRRTGGDSIAKSLPRVATK